jgi:methylated-DNA-protein-cysteine methyltransferase-like protein
VPKAKSLAFSRIRAEVMAATASIPPGRVTTYSALANHLEVVPRHVAFVLASLSSAEAAELPWHRVVAQNGALRSSSADGLRRQQKRLEQEGVQVVKNQIAAFSQLFFDWPARPDRPGIAQRRRYSDPKTPPLFPTALGYGYPLEG